jgi:hypothetical protein
MEIFFSPKPNAQKNKKILASQIIFPKNEKQTIMLTSHFLKVFSATFFHFFQNGQK